MAATFKLDSNSTTQKDPQNVHYLPFSFEHEEASIKVNSVSYFTPTIVKSPSGMEASFRGRPLKGCEVRVPQGYSAAVIGEKGDHVTCLGHLGGFVHWTLDNPPTADSRLVKALQWIELAEVVMEKSDASGVSK